MANTANLGLPLVQASQAQKHVTVNEALVRLDGAAQLTLESAQLAAPPPDPTDGASFLVPTGASGEWSGKSSQIAVFSNGGWIFLLPQPGWQGWLRDTGRGVLFDGVVWTEGALAASGSGAATILDVAEIDVALSAGPAATSPDVIPAQSVVLGVSGVVTEEVTGSAASWSLGVPGASGRYGTGLGLSLGSWVQGLTGQPQAYYSPTPLLIEAEGGQFAGGKLRLAVHLFRMTLPRV